MPHKGVTTLESEASVELNLASNANGGEYSFDVVAKLPFGSANTAFLPSVSGLCVLLGTAQFG